MTPFETEILLHYYSRNIDHEVVLKNPPIWAETRDMMLRSDLLIKVQSDMRSYDIGERGRVWIEHVLKTPPPVQQWVME